MVNESVETTVTMMATILAYTSPALGHLLPISALLAELSRRGHTVHVRTLSTGVEIGQRLGFAADAIDPRIEEIEQDDWKATNPRCRAEVVGRSIRPPRRARSRRSRRCGGARSSGRLARGCELLGCAVGGRGRCHPMGVLFAVHAAAAIARCATIWAGP